ncbi:MAG: hypothetical protein ABSA85_08950 [Terracidiphilus sp.]|jgi:hypothetical protein
MFSSVLETTIVAIAALYFFYRVMSLQQQRKFAWQLLSAKLQPKSPGAEQWHQLNLDGGQSATWERWRSMQSAGLWSMYVNAGVMLEIANFVDQNCTGVDPGLIAALRDDAMQIRSCSLVELTKYACSQVSEGTIGNAARAATYYADMLSKTALLMEGIKIEEALSFAGSLG